MFRVAELPHEKTDIGWPGLDKLAKSCCLRHESDGMAMRNSECGNKYGLKYSVFIFHSIVTTVDGFLFPLHAL